MLIAAAKAITCLEAYELAGPRHLLMVFRIEGLDREPLEKLSRLLRESPGSVACRLWVGTTIPCPRHAWRVVNGQLDECSPITDVASPSGYSSQPYRISGFLYPGGTDMGPIAFRGKLTAYLTGAKSEMGCIKLAKLS